MTSVVLPPRSASQQLLPFGFVDEQRRMIERLRLDVAVAVVSDDWLLRPHGQFLLPQVDLGVPCLHRGV